MLMRPLLTVVAGLACVSVHAGMWIPKLRKSFRNCQHSEIIWFTIGNFMPVKRHGNACVRKRSNGIRGARCTVFCILIVIKENSMTFLFPPLRTSNRRCAPFNFTR